ncbi:MAG: hypothetical protein SGJ27_26850 [Candidatus Melainabacteria bacterium]|nr:hypothetical protein [Candidatus Melainabacteria bacterium]
MQTIARKTSKSTRQRSVKLTAISCAVLSLIGLAQPVSAYYYPFYGRGFTNLLYPLRYAAYPLMGLSGPYSSIGPATPYRLLTTGRLTGYPYMYGPQMLKNYNNDEPLNNPRKRVKQKRLGQEFGVDQSASAQWSEDDQDARLNGTAPITVPPGYALVPTGQQGQFTTPQGYPDSQGGSAMNYPGAPNRSGSMSYPGAPGGSGTMTYPGAQAQQATNAAGVSNAYLAHQGQFGIPSGFNSSGHALPSADGTPPMAPQVASKRTVSLPPNLKDSAAGSPNAGARAPLADGFINLVNTKFEGNIEKALFDPETRGWAKMLGLVNDDAIFGMDFTDTRVALIKQIFADQGLDSVSKLSAIKILLNSSGANRAKP